jgi:Transposase, Mutator family
VERLAQALGIEKLSKSQVSELAKSLDEEVAAFRNRPLDAGPYTCVWVDALTERVREAGRTVNICAMVAGGQAPAPVGPGDPRRGVLRPRGGLRGQRPGRPRGSAG